MIRGTTPTEVFKLPDGATPSILAKLIVTWKQGDEIKLEKTQDDGTFSGLNFRVPLTQEETLGFEAGEAQVQLKVKLNSGQVLASQILNVPVKQILNEEVQ